MNHIEAIKCLIEKATTIPDVYLACEFINPIAYAEQQSDFPYITFLLNDFNFEPNSLRIKQNISVFGFVKSAEDLHYKRSKLLVDTATTLKKYIQFTGGSVSNIFMPYGLNAFLNAPYAGFRLDGSISFGLSQADKKNYNPLFFNGGSYFNNGYFWNTNP